ncbi:AAA family ATPase [Hahella chejuensis]|uniref:AAA family ATPase n=1 Tax=Hahella chejuensis TaxID=158327 RepID=UPI001EE4D469|nr:AAA family ATPase [Hahella chejuensis]
MLRRIDLPVAPPMDFNGVPSAQPLKVWLFPYAKERKEDMVPSLWKLFQQVLAGSIDGELFNRILRIPHTGFAKLTECMFYFAPDTYFPVDAQTKPWIKANGRELPKENWASYKELLDWLKTNTDKPFYEISYEAWRVNQQNSSATPTNQPAVQERRPRQYTASSDKRADRQRHFLNQILYGPPGTGKTYDTTLRAVSLAEPDWIIALQQQGLNANAERVQVKERYDQLVADKRIAFTTFHQSFSYEDFIEGIRAVTDGDNSHITYRVEPGVFKEIADRAEKAVVGEQPLGLSESPNIWKISIGRRVEKEMRDRYIQAGEARIGWNETGDLSQEPDDRTPEQQQYWDSLSGRNHAALNCFSEEIKVGDILLCLKNAEAVQAIGVVTSDYIFDETVVDEPNEYAHVRKVNWLLKDIELNILPLNSDRRMVQQTVYLLSRISWHSLLAELKRQNIAPHLFSGTDNSRAKKRNYVLIIDEINRGNISRIFGELITLLEPDKRKGGEDERSVTLPYSKEPITVPDNLYVLGTMNTADKSLAQLDLALRRRFEFVELMPQPELLTGISVHDVDMGELLDVMNQRIEALLDRDHMLGHAYFWPLRDANSDDERESLLADIFARRIVPLLQEYFFADWERISWVLNDPAKEPSVRFIQAGKIGHSLEGLFPGDIASELTDRRYRLNQTAFGNPEAYRGILPKAGAAA